MNKTKFEQAKELVERLGSRELSELASAIYKETHNRNTITTLPTDEEILHSILEKIQDNSIIRLNDVVVNETVKELCKHNPAVFFDMIVRELALILDARFPDHITKSEELWIISKFDCSVRQVNPKSIIKDFIPLYSLFRSRKDAEAARRVLLLFIESFL